MQSTSGQGARIRTAERELVAELDRVAKRIRKLGLLHGRMSDPRARVVVMGKDRIWTAAEMELMSPDERARLVVEHSLPSLDGLDPEFRARVEAKSWRIVQERGLLDPDRS